MAIPFVIEKYIKQIKAMSPKYDKVYEIGHSDPISFACPEKLLLAFAALSDTHLPDRDAAEKNLENIFTDISGASEKIDALILAGDIADYGLRSEYERFFKVFGRYKSRLKMLVTMGNHDVRLFYKSASSAVEAGIKSLLGTESVRRAYYSYDVNGYHFIVLCTEKPFPLSAYISQSQIKFLNRELKKGTSAGRPCFVVCHQPLNDTHGLPRVCKNGGLGRQSDAVRAVMKKYKNVFFLNGHLHSGICNYVEQIIDRERNIISINLPSYRKENNFGTTDAGAGYICEVYEDRVIFRARSFLKGQYINADNTYFEYPLVG